MKIIFFFDGLSAWYILINMSINLRPSTALKLLFDIAQSCVREGEPDLSFRQLSVLLMLYLNAPPHSVTGIAAKLKVSKPVITRALDHLAKIGLISRTKSLKDKRMLVIARTTEGALFLDRLALLTLKTAETLPTGSAVFTPLMPLDTLDIERLTRE